MCRLRSVLLSATLATSLFSLTVVPAIAQHKTMSSSPTCGSGPPDDAGQTNTSAIIIYNSGCVTAVVYYVDEAGNHMYGRALVGGTLTYLNVPPPGKACVYPGGSGPSQLSGLCYQGPPNGVLAPIPVFIYTPRTGCTRAGGSTGRCVPIFRRPLVRSAVFGVRG